MARLLNYGQDPNKLEIKTNNIKVTPTAEMRGGIIYNGVIIEVSQYNLDDILVQLLEDYGDETIIERIKNL